MSYTVIALKWRPKNFDEIIGQKHIVTTLKNALTSNRLAHAYLFAGPRGVGKTSTARILAKALNCKEGPTVTPCQKCPSCFEISQGTSFDVIEIDGASNRQIDDIRTLRENVKFAPTAGTFKIYIIDEVHMLTPEAFNALLKTLEEPPPFVKFIFATTHPHKVPPTILSRCQRLDFRRILTMEIISQLEKIVAAEQLKVDKDVLLAVAKSSDGSMRDAESVLDQLISFSKDGVTIGDVLSVLGMVEQEALFSLTEAIIKKDAKAALELFNSLIDQGKDISVFLSNLIEHFRNLMVAKVSRADSQLIDLPQDVCDRLLKQAGHFTLEEVFSAFNLLVNTQEMGKRMESLRIPFEITLVRLAHEKKSADSPVSAAAPQQAPPVRGPLSSGSGHMLPSRHHPSSSTPVPRAPLTNPAPRPSQATPAPRPSQAYPVPRPPQANPAPQSPPTHEPPPAAMAMQPPAGRVAVAPERIVPIEEVQEKWPKVINCIEQVKISVAHYLNEGSLLLVKNNLLTISFPKNCSLHKEALERKENRQLIEKNLSDLCSAVMRVCFVLSPEAKQGGHLADNPVIKSALETFDGRLLSDD